MSITYCIVLRLAALAVPTLLLASPAFAGDTKPQTPTTTGSGGSSTPEVPVGHRQPRASDLQANPPQTGSDRWLNRLNAEVDRKLHICRGC